MRCTAPAPGRSPSSSGSIAMPTSSGTASTTCSAAPGLPAAVAARRPDVAHVNGLDFPVRTWRLRRAPRSRRARSSCRATPTAARSAAPRRLRLLGRATRARRRRVSRSPPTSTPRAWRRAGFIAADQPAYQVMPASSTLHADRTARRRRARTSPASAGSPAILWVGRLNANKDPLTVLDGFERALARSPGRDADDDFRHRRAVRGGARADRAVARVERARAPRRRGPARADGHLLQRRRSVRRRQPSRRERLLGDGSVRVRRGAGGHRASRRFGC